MALDPRDPSWARIRDIFLKHGFALDEAEHAADEGLDPEPFEPKGHYEQISNILWLLNSRLKAVQTLMQYGGFSWDEAVEDRAHFARGLRRQKGLAEDDMNLFRGET